MQDDCAEGESHLAIFIWRSNMMQMSRKQDHKPISIRNPLLMAPKVQDVSSEVQLVALVIFTLHNDV